MVKLADHRGGSLSNVPTSDVRSTSCRSSRLPRKTSATSANWSQGSEGKTKGLVLNDTNFETLEAAFGPDSRRRHRRPSGPVRRPRRPLRRAEGRRHPDQAAEEGQCKRKGRVQREHGRISERRSA